MVALLRLTDRRDKQGLPPKATLRSSNRVKVVPTDFDEVLLIEPDVFRDSRGFFLESYNRRKYREFGIDCEFVQDNHSRSTRGTLRGLHAQRARPQAKLIRVVTGEIFDVVVDIRRSSPKFARWISFSLSAENFRQCYVPPGFAHAFCVTSESAEVEYKCTDFYDPTDELRIIWNDPTIGVKWPVGDPILAPGDRSARRLDELIEQLPIFEHK
jgi:dTDP-4-dehydrorhamnose 3,5-epimerase